MTDDDLRALIAECEATQETGEWGELWMAITPALLAELAKDALRFRWISRHYDQDNYSRRVDIQMDSTP